MPWKVLHSGVLFALLAVSETPFTLRGNVALCCGLICFSFFAFSCSTLFYYSFWKFRFIWCGEVCTRSSLPRSAIRCYGNLMSSFWKEYTSYNSTGYLIMFNRRLPVLWKPFRDMAPGQLFPSPILHLKRNRGSNKHKSTVVFISESKKCPICFVLCLCGDLRQWLS